MSYNHGATLRVPHGDHGEYGEEKRDQQMTIDVGQLTPGDQVLSDLNGLPLTDLPGISP